MAITWVDDVTPLDAAHMNLLEQAANKNVANGYPSLDGAGDLALAAGQKIAWAGDTTLYRDQALNLKTNGTLWATNSLVAETGRLWFAGAGGALDTSIYRAAPNIAETAGEFRAGALNVTADGGKVYFGPSYDAYLYRPNAGQVQANAQFQAGSYIVAHVSVANQVILGYAVGAAPGITFGLGLDTNLYRSAAAQLKTDGQFLASELAAATYVIARSGTADNVALGYNPAGPASAISFGGGMGSYDVTLYRLSANTLKTDGTFVVAGPVSGNRFTSSPGTANQIDLWSDGHIYFGPASDTGLYRLSAGTLKTDGAFYAAQVQVLSGDLTIAHDPGVADWTAINVLVNGLGARRVQVGPADSAGAGFRTLRVPN